MAYSSIASRTMRRRWPASSRRAGRSISRPGDVVPRIDFRAVIIAFAAEFIADIVISALLFSLFAADRITPDMSDAQLLEVRRSVLETTSCLAWLVLFGPATTVGGGYLAARLAKRIPYYH